MGIAERGDSFEDDISAVAAVEDIIDMEKEMGFGEGEDWEIEISEPNRLAYVKRAAYQVTYKIPQTKGNPGDQVRELKLTGDHAVPLNSEVRPSGEDSIADEKIKSGDICNKPALQQNEGYDSHQEPHSSEPQQPGHQKDTSGCKEGSENCKWRGCECESMSEARKERENPVEKQQGNHSMVRFSLDLGKAEKATRRVSDIKEQVKGRPYQELPWRYGSYKGVAGKVGHSWKKKDTYSTAARESLKGLTSEFGKTRDEEKAVESVLEKVDKLEGALLKQQEIIGGLKLVIGTHGAKDYGKLKQLLDASERNFRRLGIAKPRHMAVENQLKNRTEQISKLKTQCNLLENDRERLKIKIKEMVDSSGGAPKVANTVTTEREKILEHRIRDLEKSLGVWESKFKEIEAEFSAERRIWEQNLNACKYGWKGKKQTLATKLQEKEKELLNFKTMQQTLLDSLLTCYRFVDELKRQASARNKHSKDPQDCAKSESIVAPTTPKQDCTSDFALATKLEEGMPCFKNPESVLDLTVGLKAEVEELKGLLSKSEDTDASPRETNMQTRLLREESQALEHKLTKTLCSMTNLKQVMMTKESEIQHENEKLGRIIADKVEQMETLEKQLAEKDKNLGEMMQGLKDETLLLRKDLEGERSERMRLLDMQADMKRKLLKGLKRREQKYQEQVEMLKVKLDEMAANISSKDGKIEMLREELQEKAIQLDQEKQKWNLAIREVKQKAAKTILRFMHRKENGLLEHLKEKSSGQRTGEDATNNKQKEDEQECSKDIFCCSAVRDQSQKRQHLSAMSIELTGENECQLQNLKHGIKNYDEESKSSGLHKFQMKQEDGCRRRKERVSGQMCAAEVENFDKRGRDCAGKNRPHRKNDFLKHSVESTHERTFAILKDILQHKRDGQNRM